MPTEQLLLRLPDTLVRRFRRNVPSRQRSAFVRQLLEEALPLVENDNDHLYQIALAVEQDEALASEMAEWESAAIADGLARPNPKSRALNGAGGTLSNDHAATGPTWGSLVG